ncbi:Nif3-like dinuclear metal center hexameric protein [Candidatus Poribacteria bacterium]
MKVIEIHEYFKSKGDWVNWEKTCDRILWGDGETEVTGIAVCWTSNIHQLREAQENGCNLYICHEPLYHYSERGDVFHQKEVEKKQFLEEAGVVVYRCHDLWDVMPEIGIVDSWSKFLGFTEEPVASIKFYNAHQLPAGTTLEKLTRQIAHKVEELGQDVVNYIGDPDGEVTRIAVGTGAITNFRAMFSLEPDVMILTDDGTRLWESAVWSEDTGVPLILVNHATAEEPGMRNLAAYVEESFSAPVHFIQQGCLYRSVS